MIESCPTMGSPIAIVMLILFAALIFIIAVIMTYLSYTNPRALRWRRRRRAPDAEKAAADPPAAPAPAGGGEGGGGGGGGGGDETADEEGGAET